jgi:hypothetical protein
MIVGLYLGLSGGVGLSVVICVGVSLGVGLCAFIGVIGVLNDETNTKNS